VANRTVYGLTRSSNGWPMVDQQSCEWVQVPGCDVWLQIQTGEPLAILRAFAADFNEYVEPLRDPDSACWTATNSVPSSNHLSGTAMDLNWDSHPFRVADAGFNKTQIPTLRELLGFYEGTVFWGNDWTDPKDAMHFQLGSLANGGNVNTYGNPATGQFIQRKIRADGRSTFRRGGSGANVALSKKDSYSLAAITVGRELGVTAKGQKIAICTQLVETNRTMYANRNVPESLNYPYDAVGSDHDSTGLYQQRQAWGPLAETMDPAKSSRLFYLGGRAGQRGLTAFPYNTDARTPGGWAQAVQVSAYPTRYDERYAEAEQIYNRLATSPTIDPFEELMAMKHESFSIYAEPGEKEINVVDMVAALDAHGPHEQYVEGRARKGYVKEIRIVARTAAGRGRPPHGTTPDAIKQANDVLNEIAAAHPEYITAALKG
jgi:hypothetical protein